MSRKMIRQYCISVVSVGDYLIWHESVQGKVNWPCSVEPWCEKYWFSVQAKRNQTTCPCKHHCLTIEAPHMATQSTKSCALLAAIPKNTTLGCNRVFVWYKRLIVTGRAGQGQQASFQI